MYRATDPQEKEKLKNSAKHLPALYNVLKDMGGGLPGRLYFFFFNFPTGLSIKLPIACWAARVRRVRVRELGLGVLP